MPELTVSEFTAGLGLDPELLPAAKFFTDEDSLASIQTRLKDIGVASNERAFFIIDGFNPLQSEPCKSWWRDFRKALLANSVKNPKSMVCLLSGEISVPVQAHQKVSGLKVVGGRGQDIVVGCDKNAFTSFGLQKSENGAMSEVMANAYTKGLDELIANHSRTMAGTKVAHWFKEHVVPEDDPLEWLNGLESDESTRAAARIAARNMLEAIRSGKRADLGGNHFYALTISGASGRVMVRDWMEGQFENLVANIEAWFSDLSVVSRDGNGLAFDPKFYEVCLALVRNDRTKSISKNLEQLPAPSTTTLWKAAVQCLPIPQPLMVQALARFRSDLLDKDQPPLNHARMGLIKAYFVRLNKGGDDTMKAYLNKDHPDPAYHCGRLLAILAKLQHAALGDVGAGVVQRYYAASSQTPGLTLGRLVSNARNHLAKLEGGLAWWYEEQIAEVMGQLGDNAPRTLDMNGQGLFALGYYQQLASLRAGKKTDQTDKENNDE
ncbi:type I-C CRISPR-associated protein Cas8c/Csd1 [Mariprofundus erugo]|uniref:type I-C CRISPR-associated protein Cas8c/Csd1 n=1 Tax=Mariprofundus erugo TaxID=2528639 RepID=UPI0013872A61|nr:type I-C CRISPR-associated protein Cas8c/Csd1 [Mariprofundus erugo]